MGKICRKIDKTDSAEENRKEKCIQKVQFIREKGD